MIVWSEQTCFFGCLGFMLVFMSLWRDDFSPSTFLAFCFCLVVNTLRSAAGGWEAQVLSPPPPPLPSGEFHFPPAVEFTRLSTSGIRQKLLMCWAVDARYLKIIHKRLFFFFFRGCFVSSSSLVLIHSSGPSRIIDVVFLSSADVKLRARPSTALARLCFVRDESPPLAQ